MSVSRRKFLLQTGALGCCLAANPLVTPVALAQTAGEKRLVVIILRGGMDGLDVLRPLGDPLLASYRAQIGSAAIDDSIALNGFFGMHRGLSKLAPLWTAGDLSFAHAVSTPYRDKRSHFDGQDVLEAGAGPDHDGRIREGWLNRLLQTLPNATSETAFAIGREDMLVMSGSAPVSSWAPDGRLDLSPQGRLLLEHLYHDDPLFRDASIDAIEIAESLGVASENSFGQNAADRQLQVKQSARADKADVLAQFAAQRLKDDARIAAFSVSGWDTHRGQTGGITRALGNLQNAILTLKDELGPVWDQTAIVAMTEFGRTVQENGTRGTDHGTGGAMVMAGGAVNGGHVWGDWPGLEEAQLYERRDLMPTSDVRAYAAWLMTGMFGVGQTALETVVFPGLQLGRDPGVLA